MTEQFHDDVRTLQTHIRTRRSAVRSSESIKTALILPFLRTLGYDVFDPFEVVPGYAHEAGGKVDYGVKSEEAVRLVLSLSSTPEDLGTDRAQLLSQAVLNAKALCGILTNGATHHVYAADEYHVLSPEPVLVFNLDGPDIDAAPLMHLTRDAFDMATLIAGAAERRLSGAVAEALSAELADPSRSLMDAIVTRLGEEPSSLREMIIAASHALVPVAASEPEAAAPQEERRQMSEDEETAFHVVRAIAARDIDPARLVVRPALRYTAVLLDDNHHRTVARLHFNAERAKYVGTFVGRDEKRTRIAGSRDVYAHEDAIRARIAELVAQPREPENEGSGAGAQADDADIQTEVPIRDESQSSDERQSGPEDAAASEEGRQDS